MGRDVCLGDAPAFPILGVPSIYVHIIWHRTTEVDVVTRMGRGLVFRGQPRILTQWSAPQFCGFSATYSYMVWPRMTIFGVVTYNAQGRVFIRLATPLHLHKCLPRFVNDSWVLLTSAKEVMFSSALVS